MLNILSVLECAYHIKAAYPAMSYRLDITDQTLNMHLYVRSTEIEGTWTQVYEQTYNAPLTAATVIDDLYKRFPVVEAFKHRGSEEVIRAQCAVARILTLYEHRAVRFEAKGDVLERINLLGVPSNLPNTAHNHVIILDAKDYPNVSHSDAAIHLCFEKCFDLLDGMVPQDTSSPASSTVVAQSDGNETYNRMNFLTSNQLCGLIMGVQACAPNWWWSIHQSEGDIELRAAPTTAADLTSRKLMMTREGDEGVFVTGTVASFVLQRFTAAVTDLIENHVPDIKADDVKPRTLDGRDCGVYRPETRGNLSKLFSAFSQLQLPEGVEVREVMFGCCPTSLDCSIRLTNGLDLSIDLLDPDATLDGVFQAALAPFQARMPKVS